eukprot:m.64736 g.64736  ORF g.64736 m.64736 type:complete len:90 (+) comp9729_c0_seq2:2494-2763(+)
MVVVSCLCRTNRVTRSNGRWNMTLGSKAGQGEYPSLLHLYDSAIPFSAALLQAGHTTPQPHSQHLPTLFCKAKNSRRPSDQFVHNTGPH